MNHYVVLLLLVAAAATSQSRALQLPPAAAAGPRSAGACIRRERDALLAFKRGITGDPAGRLASWHEGDQDCCRWTGVRCSNYTGHVIDLLLGNDMYTDAPRRHASRAVLSGQISPSLLSLHHLESLDLNLNNLSGPAGRVPEFLGRFSNLRYLNLSGMPLVGRVPPQLGNISNLRYLDLSDTTIISDYGIVLPWDVPDLYSMDISCIIVSSMSTQAPPLLLPIGPPILPTPQPRKRGKERCHQEPTRHSARIASKPKTNLTMEEQATALLIKRSGVLFSGNTPHSAAKDEFMEQFTEPMKNTVMGEFREVFGIFDVADGADSLAPFAIEGTA